MNDNERNHTLARAARALEDILNSDGRVLDFAVNATRTEFEDGSVKSVYHVTIQHRPPVETLYG